MDITMLVFVQAVLLEPGAMWRGQEYWRVGNRDRDRKKEKAATYFFMLISKNSSSCLNSRVLRDVPKNE